MSSLFNIFNIYYLSIIIIITCLISIFITLKGNNDNILIGNITSYSTLLFGLFLLIIVLIKTINKNIYNLEGKLFVSLSIILTLLPLFFIFIIIIYIIIILITNFDKIVKKQMTNTYYNFSLLSFILITTQILFYIINIYDLNNFKLISKKVLYISIILIIINIFIVINMNIILNHYITDG
jgi:hypothetical protein